MQTLYVLCVQKEPLEEGLSGCNVSLVRGRQAQQHSVHGSSDKSEQTEINSSTVRRESQMWQIGFTNEREQDREELRLIRPKSGQLEDTMDWEMQVDKGQ